jgi:formyltetrahydrofolate hydrolase
MNNRDASTDVKDYDEDEYLKELKKHPFFQKLQLIEQQKTLARESEAAQWNEFGQFSQTLKLRIPLPENLVPILTKDKKKQKDIVEKARRDALSKESVVLAKTLWE